MTDEEWLAWCDATADQDEPGGQDEDEPDPDGLPGHWEYNLNEIVAECLRISAEEAAAAARAWRLGMPASNLWAWSAAALDSRDPRGGSRANI